MKHEANILFEYLHVHCTGSAMFTSCTLSVKNTLYHKSFAFIPPPTYLHEDLYTVEHIVHPVFGEVPASSSEVGCPDIEAGVDGIHQVE